MSSNLWSISCLYLFLDLYLSLLRCHNPFRNNLWRHQGHLQANDGHRVWLCRNGTQEERHLRRRRRPVNQLQLLLNITYSDDHNLNVKKKRKNGKVGKLAIQVYVLPIMEFHVNRYKFSIFRGRRGEGSASLLFIIGKWDICCTDCLSMPCIQLPSWDFHLNLLRHGMC